MKKSILPEHNTGIWLDQETAYIVHLAGPEVTHVESLHADVESRIRIAGEGKVSARFGRAFIDNQEKTQHRQQQQRTRFFKEIIRHLKGVQLAYIFGPGRARYGLFRMMEKDHLLAGHTAASVAAIRMNKRQATAEALAYFTSDAFRLFKKERRKAIKAAR